ncbi:MAG TPA: DUF5695 domain-containing protein, partial [Pyrinomonadaceae bacterium]|nr:DUF5695 domain-containing protein [Pyrinomonadaceae bacterium]
FLYAAKLQRIERQIHHYGSGLNAIPVLSEYRSHPDDEYLLRVGYAGGSAALTNIDREGFASAAFHSYPDTLRWDAYSGDYGMNFFGYAINAATYIADMKDFGWQAFGGNIIIDKGTVRVEPHDAMGRRIYIAPFGLWLTLDEGSFPTIYISPKKRTVTLYFDEGPQSSVVRLRVEQTANVVGVFKPVANFATERGAYVIPTDSFENVVTLSVQK